MLHNINFIYLSLFKIDIKNKFLIIIIIMIKYSLNDFNNINKNNISKIDQKILLIIESLSKKVGAVSYNKTPIF